MSTVKYSPEQLTNLAKLTPEDMAEINQRRHLHNRLGFAYQLAYVRLSGAHWAQFPAQVAFVTLDELLTFVSVQLNLATEAIADYATRQQTISEHQEQIRLYTRTQDPVPCPRYLDAAACPPTGRGQTTYLPAH